MRAITLIILLPLLAGCTGDAGPMGLPGEDGQDAFLAQREWERSGLNADQVDVDIAWLRGEDVLVFAEVFLASPVDGTRGWNPIPTLWTPDGTAVWQTGCFVDETTRRIWLTNVIGRYRVRLFVLSVAP